MARIACTKCGKKYEFDPPQAALGSDIRIPCPNCKTEIIVPRQDPVEPPPSTQDNFASAKDVQAEAPSDEPTETTEIQGFESPARNTEDHASPTPAENHNFDSAITNERPRTSLPPTSTSDFEVTDDTRPGAQNTGATNADFSLDVHALFDDLPPTSDLKDDLPQPDTTSPPQERDLHSQKVPTTESQPPQVERSAEQPHATLLQTDAPAEEKDFFTGIDNDSDLLDNKFLSFYDDKKVPEAAAAQPPSEGLADDIFEDILDDKPKAAAPTAPPTSPSSSEAEFDPTYKLPHHAQMVENINVAKEAPSESPAPPSGRSSPTAGDKIIAENTNETDEISELFKDDTAAAPSQQEAPLEDFVSEFESPPPEAQAPKSSSIRAYARKVSLVFVPTILLIACFSIVLHLLKREEGLFGQRLVGFHFEKAYLAPTADQKNTIDQLVKKAFDLFKVGIPEGYGPATETLGQALQIDERNAKALSRGICFGHLALPYLKDKVSVQQKISAQETTLATYWPNQLDQALATTCKQFAGGRYAEVTTQIEQSLFNQFKDDPLVLTFYGLALLQNKNSAKSKEVLENVARADSQNMIAVEGLSQSFIEIGSPENAQKFIRYLLSKNPQHLSAYLTLARAKSLQGAPAEEIFADLSKITEKQDASELKGQAYIIISEAFEKSGQASKAVEYLEKAATESPQNSDLPRKLGSLMLHDRRVRNYQKAIDYLKKSLALTPDQIETQVLLTEALFQINDFTQALNIISQTATKAPQNGDVQYWLGRVYARLSKDADAEKAFKEMLTLNENDARAYVMLGRIYLKTKSPQEVDGQFQRALKISETSAFTQTAYGDYLLAMKQYQTATGAYKKALGLESDYVDALIGIARANIQIDNLKEADAYLSKVIELEPQNLDALSLRVRYNMILENPAEAKATIEKMAETNSSDPRTVLTQAEFMIQTNQIDAVRALLQNVPETLELDPQFSYVKALLYEKQVEASRPGAAASEGYTYEGALNRIKKAVDSDPRNEDYLFLEARLLFKTDDLKFAEKKIQNLIKINPYYKWAYLMYGDILLTNNRPEAAIQQYQTAESLFSKKADIYVKMGKTYEKINRYTEAINYFEKARVEQPSNPQHLLAIALIYNKTDSFVKAAEYFKETIKKDPKIPDPYYYLGYIYKSYQKYEPSLRAFQRFLALSPNSKYAPEIEDQIFYLKRTLGKTSD